MVFLRHVYPQGQTGRSPGKKQVGDLEAARGLSRVSANAEHLEKGTEGDVRGGTREPG